MLTARIHKFITAPSSNPFSPRVIFWLGLSLTFAAIYSILVLQEAFSAAYVVQDDARQHVFWMRRFIDPQLFPNDLIADYFQSVAPFGYTALYRVAAAVGIDPLLFSKLLPLALSLITACYCFAVCFQLLPVPAAAFSATLLLSQGLGMTDAIISGTPKAFIYPLFLAFMYYLLRGSLVPCLVAIALQGLFYPQLVLITAVTLILRLSDRRRYLFSAAGIGVALLVILPYVLQSNEFGPVITASVARKMPEFLPGGRSRFFYDDDPGKFWLEGRAGIRLASALTPVTNAAGFLLLLLPFFPRQFPLVKQINRGIILLPQILVASVVMFFAAHALLFRLHLPSRYTGHSLRIIMSLTAGIVFIILIDAAFQAARQSNFGRKLLAWGSTIIIAIALLFYPSFVDKFPLTAYQPGNAPSLYEFFLASPKDSLIASLTDEANNLPTFAQRSILTGSEYAIPYHSGYYRQFRQRTLNLIQAQYTANPAVIQEFIQKYGVNYWLLSQAAFTPEYITNNSWIRQYQPAANTAVEQLQQGISPILEQMIQPCSVFNNQGFIILDTNCISKNLP